MQTPPPFLDDLAKLFSGAAGMALESRREMERWFHQQMEQFLSRMHVVTRDEFEVVRAMAETARMECEQLKAELAALRNTKTSA